MSHPEDYLSDHHPQNVEARARRRVVGDLRALRAWCDRALAVVDDPNPAPVAYLPRPLLNVSASENLISFGAAEWAEIHRSMRHWVEVLGLADTEARKLEREERHAAELAARANTFEARTREPQP